MKSVCKLPPSPEQGHSFTRQSAQEAARSCLAVGECSYCEVCQLLCPDLAITRDDAGRIQIDLEFCKGCGLCAYFCPKGAIGMEVERG